MSQPAILLVRFGSLGDVVLTFGAAAALARTRPDARLVYLVKREYADLVRAQPWASEVWELPADERGAFDVAPWRARIQSARFEAAVDWQTSPRSRALLAGSPRVLPWRAERWLRRRWVSFRWTKPKPVAAAWRRYGATLAPLGVESVEPPKVAVPEADRAAAAAAWARWDARAGAGPTVALAPGARWASKRWPVESYLALGESLVARGMRVAIACDDADRADLGALVEWSEREPRTLWIATGLTGLAARLERCVRAVGNDTGVMHLAAGLGLPVVAIFGSTHPGLGFAPAGEGHAVLMRDLDCQPCTLHGRPVCPKRHHRCVREITPDGVEAALERLRDREMG